MQLLVWVCVQHVVLVFDASMWFQMALTSLLASGTVASQVSCQTGNMLTSMRARLCGILQMRFVSCCSRTMR